MGLLLAVAVTSAAVDDAAAAPKVLGELTPVQIVPSLEEVVGGHQVPQSRPEPMGLEERVVCRLRSFSRLTGGQQGHRVTFS